MQRNTPPDEQQIPLLMPQQHMVLPHYMGRSKEMEIEKNVVTINENHFGRQDSFSSQSPLEDIPLLLPHEATDHDASTTYEKINGLDSDECQLNQTPGMPLNLLSNLKSRNVILWPQVEAFQRTLDFTYSQYKTENEEGEDSDLAVSDDWWETQEQYFQDVSTDETGQIGSRSSCRCQVT